MIDHLGRHRLPLLLRGILDLQRPQRVLSCLRGRLGGSMTAGVLQYARLCHGAVTRAPPKQLSCNAPTMKQWWHRGRVWLFVIVPGCLLLVAVAFVCDCVGVCVAGCSSLVVSTDWLLVSSGRVPVLLWQGRLGGLSSSK